MSASATNDMLPLASEKRQWFEFLLDDNLLADHLAQSQPDPGAWELCLVLLSNNNDAAEKNLRRKILALKIVALNNWDLGKLAHELPVHMQQLLLAEFCAVTATGHPQQRGSPYEIFARALYCRWVLRYVFKSQVPVRGPRGVVVPLPGQTDPTYVAPDVLERLERCLLEEADGCCHWLREFLESDELTPPVATATQECFSMRPPHFSGDRGVPTDMIILKAQICLDLGSYLFFKNYAEAKPLLFNAKSLLPRTHPEFARAEGFAANFETLEDSTDEEMDDADESPILQRIEDALEGRKSEKSGIEMPVEKLTAESKLLMSQDPNEILTLAYKVPNGQKLNSEWQMLPHHLQLLAKNPQVHVILAKAIELRRLEKFTESSTLFKHLIDKLPKADRLQWELAYNSICASVDVVRSAEAILAAQRAPDMPNGMLNTALVELLNMAQYGTVAGLDVRGSVMAVIRPLAQCCSSRQAGCGQNLWKVIVSFLQVKRNRTDADGCQALLFILRKLKNKLAKGILISLLAHLYNILRDDSNSSVSHEYPAFWPVSLQDASHYCLDTCTHLLQTALMDARSPFWLKTHADVCFDQKYYSVALKHYIEALVSVTNFFTETTGSTGPTIVDDTLFRRMAQCCAKLSCHTQAAILLQWPVAAPDYAAAFKSLNERNCNDSCDSLYKYMWDTNMLEFLANLHTRRGEVEAKKTVLAHMSRLELNSNNSKACLDDAAQKRKAAFLRTLAKQYFL
ncbi:integrator complex subunit 8-like isoform X2 [Varroa destructor]|uniref:INTS8 TPR repeats domain-containing protein n=1 Tax=Varroa destructor TaxID=109461 RepID=A0A7M7M964_VARDE|nr:integrator complex subunit 8-like isoform X2 [Varroa destructor]